MVRQSVSRKPKELYKEHLACFVSSVRDLSQGMIRQEENVATKPWTSDKYINP